MAGQRFRAAEADRQLTGIAPVACSSDLRHDTPDPFREGWKLSSPSFGMRRMASKIGRMLYSIIGWRPF